jgi:hypothetical protein
MAANDPITALEYNNIRGIVFPVVGNTTTGYGRAFTSSTVTGGSTVGVSDTVTEQQQFDLYLDSQAGYVHQNGSLSGSITTAAFAEGTEIQWQDIVDFNTLANSVSNFNPVTTDFPSSSFTTDLLRTTGGASCSSSRSTAWGVSPGSINHQVTINFGNNNSFRYFFNAGGEIRFDASLTGGTSGTANTKDWDWAQILSGMGTIRFGRVGSNWRTEAISPGTGTGSLVSTINSGTPTTLIFRKQGGVTVGAPSIGDPTGTTIYDNNDYSIYAGTNSAFATATQLIFNIVFNDGDTGTGGQDGYPGETEIGTPIDESVGGTTTSNVYTYTPDSDFTIGVTTYTAIRWQYPGQSRFSPIGTINSAL